MAKDFQQQAIDELTVLAEAERVRRERSTEIDFYEQRSGRCTVCDSNVSIMIYTMYDPVTQSEWTDRRREGCNH